MKIEEVAAKYGLKSYELEEFALSRFPDVSKSGLINSTINDDAVEPVVEAFKEKKAETQRKRALLKEEENRLKTLARTMPITSGHNFEGYRIVRYAGYVSGDEVATVPMGIFTGAMSNDDVNETIKKVRNIAIRELKEAAANLDCNAVIGLDFDYITIDRSGPQGTLEVKIILTANGTAVEIEPL